MKEIWKPIKNFEGRYEVSSLGRIKSLSKKVNQYNLDGTFIKTWGSIIDIQNETGINQSAISQCCNGIIKKSHGYIWKFCDEVSYGK